VVFRFYCYKAPFLPSSDLYGPLFSSFNCRGRSKDINGKKLLLNNIGVAVRLDGPISFVFTGRCRTIQVAFGLYIWKEIRGRKVKGLELARSPALLCHGVCFVTRENIRHHSLHQQEVETVGGQEQVTTDGGHSSVLAASALFSAEKEKKNRQQVPIVSGDAHWIGSDRMNTKGKQAIGREINTYSCSLLPGSTATKCAVRVQAAR
jgi:hypothetical protein